MCLLVNAQKYWRMPRDVSLVTGLAASGSFAGPTHTFITPSTAARKASCFPSSLRVGPDLSGLPNRTRRGMSGTFAAVTAEAPWSADPRRLHETSPPAPVPNPASISPRKKAEWMREGIDPDARLRWTTASLLQCDG